MHVYPNGKNEQNNELGIWVLIVSSYDLYGNCIDCRQYGSEEPSSPPRMNFIAFPRIRAHLRRKRILITILCVIYSQVFDEQNINHMIGSTFG